MFTSLSASSNNQSSQEEQQQIQPNEKKNNKTTQQLGVVIKSTGGLIEEMAKIGTGLTTIYKESQQLNKDFQQNPSLAIQNIGKQIMQSGEMIQNQQKTITPLGKLKHKKYINNNSYITTLDNTVNAIENAFNHANIINNNVNSELVNQISEFLGKKSEKVGKHYEQYGSLAGTVNATGQNIKIGIQEVWNGTKVVANLVKQNQKLNEEKIENEESIKETQGQSVVDQGIIKTRQTKQIEKDEETNFVNQEANIVNAETNMVNEEANIQPTQEGIVNQALTFAATIAQKKLESQPNLTIENGKAWWNICSGKNTNWCSHNTMKQTHFNINCIRVGNNAIIENNEYYEGNEEGEIYVADTNLQKDNQNNNNLEISKEEINLNKEIINSNNNQKTAYKKNNNTYNVFSADDIAYLEGNKLEKTTVNCHLLDLGKNTRVINNKYNLPYEHAKTQQQQSFFQANSQAQNNQ